MKAARVRWTALGGAVIAGAIGVAVIIAPGDGASARDALASPTVVPVELIPVGGDHPPLDFTPPPPSMPAGAPAIQPHLPAATGKPAFTPDDVLAYLRQHPHPDVDQSAPPATVESIEFLPSWDVASRLQTSVARPDDALLCLVTLRGSFLVHGPYGISFEGQLGYLVFDAQTGNILIEGVGQ